MSPVLWAWVVDGPDSSVSLDSGLPTVVLSWTKIVHSKGEVFLHPFWSADEAWQWRLLLRLVLSSRAWWCLVVSHDPSIW